MIIRIESSNGLAIYEQVVRQIKFLIADGALRAGEFVPSVRELAKRLAINPNTVSRAYRQLQDDGVLANQRGMGLQVSVNAQKECKAVRLVLIRKRLRSALAEAIQSGLPAEEISNITADELKKLENGQGSE